jgi:hypothetical protein
MSAWIRWRKRALKRFCCVRHPDQTPSFQYRIPPPEEKQNTFATYFTLVEDAFVAGTLIINRANFLVVILVCIALYFVMIFIFALFIVSSSQIEI